jgi:hypothetical protein
VFGRCRHVHRCSDVHCHTGLLHSPAMQAAGLVMWLVAFINHSTPPFMLQQAQLPEHVVCTDFLCCEHDKKVHAPWAVAQVLSAFLSLLLLFQKASCVEFRRFLVDTRSEKFINVTPRTMAHTNTNSNPNHDKLSKLGNYQRAT